MGTFTSLKHDKSQILSRANDFSFGNGFVLLVYEKIGEERGNCV
jgi:hypothetical protein